MNQPDAKLMTLFGEALACATPEARAAFLDCACAGRPEVRARIEDLLRAHESAGDFLRGATAGRLAPTPPAPLPSEEPGVVIGPYKLLQPIGEGGMGSVWMAEQIEPVRRKVALKIIKPGMDSRQVVARFEQERQALALMDHPNIARVFDAGTTAGGRPYFVMELVKGVPITQYCDEHRLTPRERLALFVPVCQAIQHAHQKGVIHRDVKPSNVLVAPYDGRPVVKVIDFGIAKAAGLRLTERTLFTEFGAVVGTPEYMSPEQAELNNQDVDTRSDVYGLGVLLYELLTGTTPLDKARLRRAAFAELLRIIREEEPPKPSTRLSQSAEALPAISAQRQTEPAKLARLVRGELDWIVMKCLEKDRDRRYETANGLAMDLQRYLADEPVQACPPSAAYRLRKLLGRNKLALTAGAAVAAALLLGTGVSVWQAVEATRARDAERLARRDLAGALEQTQAHAEAAEAQKGVAQRNAAAAKDQERRASRRFCAAQVGLAQRALDDGDLARALDLLETLRPTFDQEDLRPFEWYYLWQQCRRGHRGTLRAWKGETRFARSHGSMRCVAFSPDGRTLAAAGWDRRVRLWDVKAQRRLATLEEHTQVTSCLAFSPDGRALASGGADGTVVLWDVASMRPTATLRPGRAAASPVTYVMALAFSPDGRVISAGSSDRLVRAWSLPAGNCVAELRGHAGVPYSLAFSSDGRTLASACHGSVVKAWDVASWKERFTVPGLNLAFFLPDGTLAAQDTSRAGFRLWDVTTGTERKPTTRLGDVLAKTPAVVSVSASADWKTLAWADDQRNVKVCDAAAGTSRPHHGRSAPIACVAVSPDGRTLASAADDGGVELWDSAPADPLPVRHPKARAVVFSPDGRLLAASSQETTRVIDAASGRALAAIDRKTAWVGHPAAFSHDSRTLALAGEDGAVGLRTAR